MCEAGNNVLFRRKQDGLGGSVYNPDTGKSMEIGLEQGAYVMDLWVPQAAEGRPTPGPPFLPGRPSEWEPQHEKQ